MKNIIIAWLFVSTPSFFVHSQDLLPQTGPDGSPIENQPSQGVAPRSLKTFSGKRVDWSCSNTTKNPDIINFLEKNWKEGEQSTLQGLADKAGLLVEFLWKINSFEVEGVLLSECSFLTGEKPDKIEMMFSGNGSTKIILWNKGKICGRVRGWTSSRDGKHPQLSEGEYKVLGFNPKGYSKTYNTPMPNQILLSGEAKERAISIHTGDVSGNGDYHGCIRVGQLVGCKFGELIAKGTPIVVSYVN